MLITNPQLNQPSDSFICDHCNTLNPNNMGYTDITLIAPSRWIEELDLYAPAQWQPTAYNCDPCGNNRVHNGELSLPAGAAERLLYYDTMTLLEA
jgi:hypothetical protein